MSTPSSEENQHQRERELFEAALALPSAAERAAYLQRHCPSKEMRRSIQDMLREAQAMGDFLRTPAEALAANSASHSDGEGRSRTRRAGERIDNYVLLEPLGEGGHGVVWLAAQERPVKRRVAIKFLKAHHSSASSVARFQAEIEALARLSHPHIAHVFDAGTTADGHPYFTMEVVEGQPLHAYCRDHDLDLRARLRLFVSCCQAIQHAHQRGLIHRDIKSSNVLVAAKDGLAQPKVIDFGIAKIVDGSEERDAELTAPGGLLGSPASMSPEQIELGAGMEIDSRTDVYSLGVLLYQLLTDRLPVEPKSLGQTGFHEMLRRIREEEPLAPSKLVALDRDLDWITLKCLEKDRDRRYSSAAQVAEDVTRFLAHEPVSVHPPTLRYSFSKLWKRRRAAVIGACGVAAMFVVGLIGTGYGLLWALSERDRVTIEVRATEAARAEAAQRVQDLEQLSRFQEEQIASSSPALILERLRDALRDELRKGLELQQATPERITAALQTFEDLLATANLTDVSLRLLDAVYFDRAVAAAEAQFEHQPRLKATMLQSLATNMRELGRLSQSRAVQLEALALREREFGDSAPETIASRHQYAVLLHEEGHAEESEAVYRQALAASLQHLGPRHEQTAGIQNDFAELLSGHGASEEAKMLIDAGLQTMIEKYGEASAKTLVVQNMRVKLLMEDGRTEEATASALMVVEAYERQSLSATRSALAARNNLATSQFLTGQIEDAEQAFRRVHEGYRELFGDYHDLTLTALNNLGVALWSQRKLEAAEAALRQAAEATQIALGAAHSDTVESCLNLASVLRDSEQWRESEDLFRKIWNAERTASGAPNYVAAAAAFGLSELLRLKGERFDEALELSTSALDARTKLYGALDHRTVEVRFFRALLLMARAEFAAAEDILLDLIDGEGAAFLLARHQAKLPRTMLELYEQWGQAEPGGKHAEQVAVWRAKVDSAGPGR